VLFHTDQKNVCGPLVARYRNSEGWFQAEFAAKYQLVGWDVSRDIIARIEGQVRWVGDYELAYLAHVLGVSILELLPPECR
jgi:transcriptional regulator with XRE-family HTH domain